MVYAPDSKPGEFRSFGKCVRFDIVDLCQSGGMADAADSKSVARKGVWVQVPPLVFNFVYSFLRMFQTDFFSSFISLVLQ